MNQTADFSPCGNYRYRLTREWDADLGSIAFVGLNPSTANAETNDPTIRRVIAFGKREGFGGVAMFNLFNIVSADPRVLLTSPDPLGPDSEQWLQRLLAYDQVVVCWGAFPEAIRRAAEVVARLDPTRTYCLGKTKQGYPRHPLYLAANSPLIPYQSKD